jgi:hypothetical protein
MRHTRLPRDAWWGLVLMAVAWAMATAITAAIVTGLASGMIR